jgi:pyruvate formate lyase activating enzyme
MTGMVFDIQKFSIHDGPGIRTTVFLKGCPLRCLWCHNPESQESGLEISLIPSKCIGCGYCFKACPLSNHVMEASGERIFHRARCQRCGICAEKCYAGAIELIGREMSVEEVLADVEKDRPFYETSGGGMTLSGGEPLFQFDFTRALLREAKRRELHTCIETCGFAPFELLEQLVPFVDLFLYDCKETDPVRHREYTGVPREVIVENLVRLDRLGAKTVLRCPIVPGLNARDDHLAGIAALANRLDNIREVHIMPYNPLGKSKHERFGKDSPMESGAFPDAGMVDAWVAKVADLTRIPVKNGATA